MVVSWNPRGGKDWTWNGGQARQGSSSSHFQSLPLTLIRKCSPSAHANCPPLTSSSWLNLSMCVYIFTLIIYNLDTHITSTIFSVFHMKMQNALLEKNHFLLLNRTITQTWINWYVEKSTFFLLTLFNYADLKCMDMKINGKQPFKSCRLTYRRWTNGIWHRVRYKYCYYGGKREKRANTDVLHSNAASRVYWIYITLFIAIIITHYSRVCASCS